MNTRVLQIVVVAAAASLIGYYVGVNRVAVAWQDYKPSIEVKNALPPTSSTTADFSMFWQVWDKLSAQYYDKKVIDPQAMLNGAITGMVESIGDPYTVYLPPTQNNEFKQGMAGQFEGIGAELGMEEKQIIVVAPISGMPAQKAGIKAGDAILEVDDKPTTGWTLAQTVEKIRGPKGTKVKLTILHKNAQKPQDISIERNTITVKSVEGWIKKIDQIDNVKINNAKDAIYYVRLSQFGDNSNKEWVETINTLELDRQNRSDVKGVVLDLRNNPGGYLNDAVFIASEFVKGGTIVIQDKGSSGQQTTFSVSRRGLLTDIPLVVLINKGSASASEIVAGALKDHNRAVLIGETSFGKGTIQQAEDLGDGAGLHVTIAKWLTPKLTWVHEKGLTPDIEVVLDEKDPSHDLQLEKAILELLK